MNRVPRLLRAAAHELWLPALLVAVLWAVSVRHHSFFLPSLPRILRAFKELWLFDRLGSDALPSVLNLLAGLLLAALTGIALGLLLGRAGRLYDATRPVLEFLRAVPGIALVPVALVLLGTGDGMKAALIAYGTVWPILLGTVDGVRSLDPTVEAMADSYRLPRGHRLLRVVLPGAAPQILAGARVSVALGVVLIVASEYTASTHGIGYLQLQSQRTFDIPEMWASLLLLGILGYASNLAFRALESRLLRWYTGQRAAGQGDTPS
uniref:ABC transporter permease n=1 Tax=Streptomyces sp. NBC_00008 TaxID=2903610 RepID=A0AAU2W0V0_9ACTN